MVVEFSKLQRKVMEKTFQFLDETVIIREAFYEKGGRTAIEIRSVNGYPIAKLTVNIPEVSLEDGEMLIKTWSENAELAVAALASGHFIDTGKRVQTGYVEAQIWKWK